MAKITMIKILDIKIDNISKLQAIEKIDSFLKFNQQHYIVTPNPEFLVAAQNDQEFKNILNNADLSIPDGTGLIFASFGKIKNRITGVDLIDDICQLAVKNNSSIYLLGGKKNIAQAAAYKLHNKYKDLKIAGTQDGMTDYNTDIYHINQAKPDILLVAFGQVKQEKWIYYNLNKMETVKVAIGVGGAFDYISGNVKRAPHIMRRLGLEWLYRLTNNPKRGKRIYNAVIKFPILVIIDKLKS